MTAKYYLRNAGRRLTESASPWLHSLQSGLIPRKRLIENLDVYFPASFGYWRDEGPTVSAANHLPTLLVQVLDSIEQLDGRPRSQPCLEITTDVLRSSVTEELALKLAKNLTSEGSDKATIHNYQYIYAYVLHKLGPERPLKLLEIGLGSRDPSIMSTMGRKARPGASLRAFRNVLPNAQIYGADFDKKSLFDEERIQTTWVDQMSPQTFSGLDASFRHAKFDIVVDDGLHSPEANLNTLLFALESATPDGWIVIEDIPRRSLSIWRLVARLLQPSTLGCWLVECSSSYAFVVSKSKSMDLAVHHSSPCDH